MSIFSRWLSSGAPPRAAAQLALPAVLEAMHEAVTRLEDVEVDAALLRAQLGDRCRDAGVAPVGPAAFDLAVRDLDAEGWRRLAGVAALWGPPETGRAIAAVAGQRGAAPVLDAMLAVVRGKPLLTMTVLRTSGLRVEELARAALAALGIAIAGEAPARSAAALQRLDYERLLAQAEQARAAAEGRMAQLKQAQDEDDQARNPRRGKW